MTTAFDLAVASVLSEEGGYTNDSRDPGGETKYGICKRSYPALDIRNLTREQAIHIYQTDYWDACRCSDLPSRIAVAVFDSAVNSGVGFAARTLQRALRVTDDGRVGPNTVAAAYTVADESLLLMHFYGHRLKMLADLATWDVFGRGWARRVARDLTGA